MLADYHSRQIITAVLAAGFLHQKLWISPLFFNGDLFLWSADLKKHPRNIFPCQFLHVCVRMGMQVSREDGKAEAHISPCVCLGSAAWAVVYQALKYSRLSTAELALNYQPWESQASPSRCICPEGSLQEAAPPPPPALPVSRRWGLVSVGLQDGHCGGDSARFWAWEECRLSGEDPFMYGFQKVCFLHQ